MNGISRRKPNRMKWNKWMEKIEKTAKERYFVPQEFSNGLWWMETSSMTCTFSKMSNRIYRIVSRLKMCSVFSQLAKYTVGEILMLLHTMHLKHYNTPYTPFTIRFWRPFIHSFIHSFITFIHNIQFIHVLKIRFHSFDTFVWCFNHSLTTLTHSFIHKNTYLLGCYKWVFVRCVHFCCIHG